MKYNKIGFNFEFRLRLLLTALVNWVVSWLIEEFIVENKDVWNSLKVFQKRRHLNKKVRATKASGKDYLKIKYLVFDDRRRSEFK